MEQSETIEFDQYVEYLIFLFLHVAHADFTVKSSEINSIISKIDKNFPEAPDPHSLFLDIKDMYENLNDDEIESTVVSNLHKFDGELQPEKVIRDLHDIIASDGLIMENELKLFKKLKSMLRGL